MIKICDDGVVVHGGCDGRSFVVGVFAWSFSRERKRDAIPDGWLHISNTKNEILNSDWSRPRLEDDFIDITFIFITKAKYDNKCVWSVFLFPSKYVLVEMLQIFWQQISFASENSCHATSIDSK